MKLFKIFLVLACLNGVSQFVNSQAKVFDVGQGNCVAVRHDNKAILIDAGSTESDYQAFYASKSNKWEDEFDLFQVQEYDMGTGEANPLLVEHQKDRGSQSTSSSPESIKGKAAPGDKKKYDNTVIKNIQEFIATENFEREPEIVVVLSHSDNDHNNWIPEIFTEEKTVLNIKHVILGGFSRDYKEPIKTWLELEHLRDKLIYTGTYRGEAEYPPSDEEGTEWELNLAGREISYARPYWSFFRDKTETEQRIEQALKFSEGGPEVQILSMNGGHILTGKDRNLVTVLNADPNANSIVLRFQRKTSFVVSGDAEEATWRHMYTMYRDHVRHEGPLDLKTDYFLLSHHGSKSKNSTTKNLLKFFDPSFIMVSAGHVEHHHHPSGSAVGIALKHLEERGFETQPHYITYYKMQEEGNKKTYLYSRRYTRWPLFSTITNGALSFNLVDRQTKTLISSRQKQPFFTSQEGDKHFIADKVRRFSTEGDLWKYIMEKIQASLLTGKKYLVWEEDSSQSSRTRQGSKSRTYIINPTPGNEGSSSSTSTEVQNFVIRHKAREGEPEQWILYNVEPVEDETEGESSSGGAAGSSSAQ